jgi:uncharacterized BrkB/YihY/UPF0761 family membrane protein
VVNYGLRSGGGIGDMLSSIRWEDKDSRWRIVYEISFFFLVIVILLNIIFGIIIDTFGGMCLKMNYEFIFFAVNKLKPTSLCLCRKI